MSFDDRVREVTALGLAFRTLISRRDGLEHAEDRGYATPADLASLATVIDEYAAMAERLNAQLAELEREPAWLAYRDSCERRLGALAASRDGDRLAAAAALYHWSDWRHAASPFQDVLRTFADGVVVLARHREAIDELLAESATASAAEELVRTFAMRLDARLFPQVVPIVPRDPVIMPLASWGLIAGPEGARHMIAVVHGSIVLVQGPNANSVRADDASGREAAWRQIEASVPIWIRDQPLRVGFAEAVVFVHAFLAAQLPAETWAVGVGEYRGSVRRFRDGNPTALGVVLTRQRDEITLVAGDYRAVVTSPKDTVAPEIAAALRVGP